MSSHATRTDCGFELEAVERTGPAAPETPDYRGAEGKIPRPTDEDVRRVMADVRKARAILTPLFGLDGWEITWIYHRDPQQKEPDRDFAAMWVSCNWPYKLAIVHISIYDCYDDGYGDLFEKVAHELAHLLVEPLVEHTAGHQDKHVQNTLERTVTEVARAVINAYQRNPADDEQPPSEEGG